MPSTMHYLSTQGSCMQTSLYALSFQSRVWAREVWLSVQLRKILVFRFVVRVLVFFH